MVLTFRSWKTPFAEHLVQGHAAEERGVELLLNLRLQAGGFGREHGVGIDAHQLGRHAHHLSGGGVDFATEHGDVDAVPQALREGHGAHCFAHADDAAVGVSRQEGMKVGTVEGAEVCSIAVVPNRTSVLHLCSDVCQYQAQRGASYGIITGQFCHGIKHGGVVAVEGEPFQALRTGLPRGVAREQSDEGHINRAPSAHRYRHHCPRLCKSGDAPLGVAGVGADVVDVPRARDEFGVLPFVGQCVLPFVKLVVAEGAEGDAHVFEHLRHESLGARGGIEETAAEVVAGRHGDVVGIDLLEGVERLHHIGSTGHALPRVGDDAGVEVVDGEDGHRDRRWAALCLCRRSTEPESRCAKQAHAECCLGEGVFEVHHIDFEI